MKILESKRFLGLVEYAKNNFDTLYNKTPDGCIISKYYNSVCECGQRHMLDTPLILNEKHYACDRLSHDEVRLIETVGWQIADDVYDGRYVYLLLRYMFHEKI